MTLDEKMAALRERWPHVPFADDLHDDGRCITLVDGDYELHADADLDLEVLEQIYSAYLRGRKVGGQRRAQLMRRAIGLADTGQKAVEYGDF